MLIDSTYFLRDEIVIPNLADSDAVIQKVNNLIEVHEPRFLQDLFGYGFYKLFTAGIAAMEQRWIDIRDGVDYVDSSNRTLRWNGLIDETTNVKISPIANYVYYHYQRSLASQSTGIGEVETVPAGAKSATPAEKMVQAWNEMVEYSWQFKYFMNAPSSITAYPEWPIQRSPYITEVYKKISVFNF